MLLDRGGARGGLGGWGAVAASSRKKFVSGEEFETENCVIMHRKIPSILFLAPPRRANPGTTPAS